MSNTTTTLAIDHAWNRFELFEAMVTGDPVIVTPSNQHTLVPLTGMIQSIEREDGSGYNFMVKVETYRLIFSYFISTIPGAERCVVVNVDNIKKEV